MKVFTVDHKPDAQKEYNRIIAAGGNLYKRPTEKGVEFPVRVNPG